MRRLGELLLERGAITISELHTALEACQRMGGRLGTHLLRLSYVEEKTLLEALGEQYGVPFVPEEMLHKSTPEVRSLLPLEIQRRYLAIPFAEDRRGVDVAVVNPADAAVVDDLKARLVRHVRPHIATESAILGALEDVERESTPVAEPAVSAPGTEEWERLWSAPAIRPSDLDELALSEHHGSPSLSLATFPDLNELVDSDDRDPTLDLNQLLARLPDAHHRDDIGDLLLRFAAKLLSRSCLLTVHKDRVTGWLARGQGVAVEDVQSAAIPFDQPSVIATLRDAGDSFAGVLPAGEGNRLLAEVFDPPPVEAVVVPVRVKGRVVLYLFGDNPGVGVTGVPIDDLEEACTKAGLAFEVLILRHKITGEAVTGPH